MSPNRLAMLDCQIHVHLEEEGASGEGSVVMYLSSTSYLYLP
jgi:hypothetical protein